MVSRSNRPVKVTVYRITGWQGPINVPHRFCEECDLTIRAVQRVIEEVDDARVTFAHRPWMLWFWKPLLRGGWHAPIFTIDGRIISQGVVPGNDVIRGAITEALVDADRHGTGRADTPVGAMPR